MTTFVINLRNIASETSKLAEQLRYMKINEVPYEIINFSLDELIEEIDTFYITFLDLLDAKAAEKEPPEPDIYGNIWADPFQYNYAEITYNNFARIDKIRLLGVGEDLQKIRFLIVDVENPYSVTALRLIENIKEINKSPAEVAFQKLLECKKRNAWSSDLDSIGNIFNNENLPPYRYTWEQLTKNFFSPFPVYNNGEISEARIQKIKNELKNGPFTREALEKNLSKIDKVKLQVEEKKKKEIIKKETPLDWLNRQLKKVSKTTGVEISANEFGGVDARLNPTGLVSQFIDKYSLGCIIKEAAECLIPKDVSCRDVFANIPPGQFFERLKTIFPAGDETLTQIESAISDSIMGTEITKLTKNIKDLKTWIEEDRVLLKEIKTETEKQNLENAIQQKQERIEQLNEQLIQELETKREQYQLQDRQIQEFSNGGNIAVVLSTLEGPNSVTVTNAIIAAIDTIVPFEQLCSAFTSMFSLSGTFPFVNFEGLPLFELQEPRPLNDPYSSLSFEISDAFIIAVAQGLLSMIEGIVQDLVNCDTLDQFIKNVLDEGTSGNNLTDSITNLFGRPAGVLEQYMDQNFDSFIDSISSKTSRMFELSGSNGKIPIGIDQEATREIFNRDNDSSQTLQAIAAAAGRTALETANLNNLNPDLKNSVLNSQKNWIIDVTGTKFEVEVGAQIFDLEEIDNYFDSLRNEQIQFLSDLDKFTPRALADAAGIDPIEIQTTPTQQQTVADSIKFSTEEKQEIKRELGCIMKNLTSILLPSQVLSLLSGNATEKTKEIAFEILEFCDTNNIATIFNNQNRFAGMLSNFGRLAGLSNLQDELRILIDSPEFQRQTFITKCEPFDSIEQFREELLAKTLPKEKAKEIIRSLNRQRINRFNELSDRIIKMSNGMMTSGSSIDTNSYLMNAIRAAKADEELPGDLESSQQNLDPNSIAQQKAKEFMDNSPVIQDMFNVVLDSIFLPIETTVRTDLSSMAESFSDIEEVIEPLPRTIKINTGPPFGEVEAINPKFKSKIEAGLVPVVFKGSNGKYAELVDKSLLAEDSILPQGVIDILKGFGTVADENVFKFAKYKVSDPNGEKVDSNKLRRSPDDESTTIAYVISGDENSLYTRPSLENGLFSTLPPVAERINKKVVGSSIRRNINSFSLSSRTTKTVISFSINGNLNEIEEKLLENKNISILNTQLQQFIESTKKTWEIKFSEVVYGDNTITNYVSLNTNGKTLTSINGAEDFFVSNFEYSKPTTIGDSISQRLLRRYETLNIGRKDVFDDLIIRKLTKFVQNSVQGNPNFAQIFKKDFEIDSEELFSRFMGGFVNTFIEGIKNSNLLQVANKTSEGNSVTYLELLDLHKCNDIMEMNKFRNDIRNIQARIVDEQSTLKQLRGEEKRPSKIATATEMVLSNLICKITCLDFILKILPAYDYFAYSQQVIKNDMIINIICKMFDFELERLDKAKQYKNSVRGGVSVGQTISIQQFVKDNIVKFYEIKKQDREFREITQEERNKFNKDNFSYPIELKAIVEKHLEDLLSNLKIIAGVEDRRALQSTNDFLKFIIENLPIINVGTFSEIANQEDRNVFSYNNFQNSLVLQRYIKFGKINKNSNVFQEIPEEFRNDVAASLENSVFSLKDGIRLIENLYKIIRKDFYLYQCDDNGATNSSLFLEPYSYGIRMVAVKKRQEIIDTEWGQDAIIFNNKAYPYNLDFCRKQKAGIVKESDEIIYDVYPILEENIQHNKTELASAFLRINQENKHDSYLPKLKELIIEDDKSNLFFSYALPLQEIVSLLLLHSSLSNNTKKMKYMLEPSKKKIQDMIEYIATVGDSRYSSQRIRETIEAQREERENVGNPSGPLNFDALKLFQRTPIQILKSMAIITDPNIMLTDKVISTVSLLHSLAQLSENTTASLPIHGENQDQPREPIKIPKPFLPYNITSLLLLPFPVFGGLIPFIPPLTSYNIASPIGPIFLALEPLLWDLPYYSEENKEALGDREDCNATQKNEE